MSLFDKFKKQEPVKAPTEAPEPYLGDLNKTDLIFHLVQVPPSERDENWQKALLDNIVEASFRCGNPQVVIGPDGFPYFQLFLPEPNQPFECFVIDRLKDDFLLEQGLGVVINPGSGRADWVLSYGDILNLSLNGTFYTTGETPFSRASTDEVFRNSEEILIAQPSEAILPQFTRQLLRNFLKKNGVPEPKILLLVRHNQDGKGVYQDLVFNLTPELFDSEATFRQVLQSISWFLPRHYSLVGMEEEAMGNGFLPL